MAHVPERKEDMSSYTEGQTHQLMEALETVGFTPAEVTKLGQFGKGLNDVRCVLNGRAKIVQIEIESPAPRRIIEPVFLPSVTSDGRTGKQFVTSLKKANYNVGSYAESIMTIKDKSGKTVFVSTTGVTYKPVVILGEQFEDDERITSNIRKFAEEERKYITPPG